MKFRVLNTFAAAAASVLMLLSCTDSNEKNLPRKKPTKEMAEAKAKKIARDKAQREAKAKAKAEHEAKKAEG